ncbi:DUF6778 family protein [uncultured Tateyamaria sp.]|uniref:DUF6778 family protein n=1 Tax=uncultured Tateyamaria sp. TaxID=455651 RepID=UPI0026336A23|nr:DUF6778 family protein [uncultured Tateyamaria sp.]
MKRFKLVLVLVLGGLVSACANPNIASRNAPFETTTLPPAAQPGAPSQGAQTLAPLSDVRVEAITVRVPRSLKVSEANRFLPSGDIVWRDDPVGDRYQQVQAIFETALARGTAPLEGALPIALDIEVTRFHALTEKARYTTGGVHNISFFLTLRDPATGVMLSEPRHIRADLSGLGGRAALQAEARGQTQKVRITDHLAHVIRQELTTVEGFENPKLGLIQAMNQI